MKLGEYFQEEPCFAWTAAGFLLAGIAGILDRTLAGGAVLLDVLFLIPIGLVGWHAGVGSALSIAAACAGIWWAAESAAPMDAATRFLLFTAFAVLLPSVRTERDHEQESSQNDYLTRTLSKRGFLTQASLELQRAQRYQRPFTVAGLDIDRFRIMNERFGHQAADNLLRSVARNLKGKIRSSDLAARLGNDEFALFFPETQSEAAQIVLQRLHKSLLDMVEKNEWPVTFSIGAVTYLQAPESVQALLKKMDELVGTVKLEGRNRVRHEVVGTARVAGS